MTSISLDPTETLRDFLVNRCRQYAGHIALQSFSREISYAELDELSTHFASYLQQKLGMQKGDRFAIMLPNVLQFMVALLGAIKIGLVVVNINPLYTARELSLQLRDSGAKAIIVLENFARTLSQGLPDTDCRHVLVTKPGDLLGWRERALSWVIAKWIKRTIPKWHIAGATSFLMSLRQGKKYRLDAVPLTGQDLVFLQYTGGTTGTVKAAMLTHSNVVANIYQCLAWVSSKLGDGSDTVVTALPLYHIFSLTGSLFFMGVGSRLLLISNPRHTDLFIKTLKRHPFSVFVGLNTMFNNLMDHHDFADIDFSSLRLVISGGMALQKPVADRWQVLTGQVIIEGYGLTEASPVVSINPVNITHFNGSIGQAIPLTEISIRNKQAHSLPPGEYGEIWVRGPQVMRGYWHKPEETAQVLTSDGWLRTGDVGYVGEQSFVYVVDREKDMIIVSGFNVYPNEIEEILVSHPAVKEAAVIGVPNEKTGEAVKAFIVKRAGQANITADELKQYCQDRLTHYKLPKFYEFVPDLPKSPVGKVLRRVLRK
jgi:long-chain acyl-CoA synthetase